MSDTGRRRGARAVTTGVEEASAPVPPRRVHPLLIVLAVIGSLHLFVLLAIELDRNLVTSREVARLQGDVLALSSELEQLEEVARHGDNFAYRELLARQQGYVHPGESLLVTGRE